MPKIPQPNLVPSQPARSGDLLPRSVAADRLLSVVDFARAIGRSERTVYDLVNDGRVAAIRIGAHRFGIRASEIQRFLNNPCSKPHPRRASASSDSKETAAA
jgi:predicted DNA-binding transcriptional regulator AlpA